MANQANNAKKWIGPDPTYKIPPVTLNDPNNRHVKVITIGAGMSGIMLAYKMEKECQNVTHVIYERNDSVGGTWFENRYPGCACDVPSHAYTFPFAPNPNWPRLLASSKDILNYARDVVDVLGLGKYIHLNHQIAGAWWNDERGKWEVLVQVVVPKTNWSSTEPLTVVNEFWDECDVLLHATGILNRWKYPDIKGLDKFKGRVVHTAGWPGDYGEDEWKGEDVVVIGSGASSIQTVPAMQPYVKHMDIFVRTPVWFVQIAEHYGNNHEYTEEDKKYFRENPDQLITHVKEFERKFNIRWDHNIVGTDQQKALVSLTADRMRSMIKDDKLFKGFLPSFPVNCRRMTPGDPYMTAVQQPNVSVQFTFADQITETGVIGGDGIERKCDTIVCATGFDCTHVPLFPVVGKRGIDLRDKWKDASEAYFGLACPDMPNWLTFLGPNWPVAQGSIMAALDANTDYAIKLIHKLQNDLLKSFCPRQDATDAYNQHTQTWAKLTVWGEDCRTWYKDLDTGRLRAVYAGSSLHYSEILKSIRGEDMDFEYLHKNKFALMGIGRHVLQSKQGWDNGLDPSPYANAERIDPRWLQSKVFSPQ